MLSRFSHVDVQASALELGTGDDKLVWDLSFLTHTLRVDTCNGLNKKTEVRSKVLIQYCCIPVVFGLTCSYHFNSLTISLNLIIFCVYPC